MQKLKPEVVAHIEQVSKQSGMDYFYNEAISLAIRTELRKEVHHCVPLVIKYIGEKVQEFSNGGFALVVANQITDVGARVEEFRQRVLGHLSNEDDRKRFDTDSAMAAWDRVICVSVEIVRVTMFRLFSQALHDKAFEKEADNYVDNNGDDFMFFGSYERAGGERPN